MSTEKIEKIDTSVGKSVESKYADATLQFLEEHGDKVPPLTPEADKRLRRKLYLRLMGLLSAVNIVLFVSGGIVKLVAHTRSTRARSATELSWACSRRLASRSGSTTTSTPCFMSAILLSSGLATI
jgi:hypothetical protein